MSSFTKPLILKFLKKSVDGKWFELHEEFEFYWIKSETERITYTVPKGFQTDFASIPKPLRWLFSPVGLHGKAAVLHDYLCEYATDLTRKEVDELFLICMKILGVGFVKRKLMYRGVRTYSIVTRAKAGYKND